jgi:phosphoribosylaminoimidazole-succinocarboxamide synthase
MSTAPPHLVLLLGSASDLPHAQAFDKHLAAFNAEHGTGVRTVTRICSAHKNPAELDRIVAEYEATPAVLAYVTCVGRSNALSAVVDGLTLRPVIAMPILSNDTMYDIYSSLRMPTGVAPMVVLGPANAFCAAMKLVAAHNTNVAEGLRRYKRKLCHKMHLDDTRCRYDACDPHALSEYARTAPGAAEAPQEGEAWAFVRQGKVRRLYRDTSTTPATLVMRCSNQLSAFDRHLCDVPFKGIVLNEISRWWFKQTRDLVPNHVLDLDDAGHKLTDTMRVRELEPILVEFVVRGYVAGSTKTSIWKNYERGVRDYCGHTLPEGLRRYQKLPQNLVTPTTKGAVHDELISAADIVAQGRMTQAEWDQCEAYALRLFAFGQTTAAEHGMILVDTKYEFGKDPATGDIVLMDELHTPDSSRYWLQPSYHARLAAGDAPEAIDKDIARKWVQEQGLDPYDASVPITVPADVVAEVSRRYMQLYDLLTGEEFRVGVGGEAALALDAAGRQGAGGVVSGVARGAVAV